MDSNCSNNIEIEKQNEELNQNSEANEEMGEESAEEDEIPMEITAEMIEGLKTNGEMSHRLWAIDYGP